MPEEWRCMLLISCLPTKTYLPPFSWKLVDHWQENPFVACSFPIIPSYLHTCGYLFLVLHTRRTCTIIADTSCLVTCSPGLSNHLSPPFYLFASYSRGMCDDVPDFGVGWVEKSTWEWWYHPSPGSNFFLFIVHHYYSVAVGLRFVDRVVGSIMTVSWKSLLPLPHEEEIQLKEKQHQRQQAPRPATSNNHKWKLYVAVVCSCRSHDSSSTGATGYGWRGQSRGRLSTVFWVKSFTHVLLQGKKKYRPLCPWRCFKTRLRRNQDMHFLSLLSAGELQTRPHLHGSHVGKDAVEILLRTQWSRDDDLFDIAYPISECSGVGGTL